MRACGAGECGVVAVDGTKIAAAATHHAKRSYEHIAAGILEEAARTDGAEDALYGEARGDELPEGLRTSGDRRKGLCEAEQALEAERAAQARSPFAQPPGAAGGVQVRARREGRKLERRVVEEHAAWHARGIASDGWRRVAGARANIKPYPMAEQPAGKLTSPTPTHATSRPRALGPGLQRAGRRHRRADRHRREISIESLDTVNPQPILETARQELCAAGVADKPGVLLADAGYWKNDAIDRQPGHPNARRPDADKRKEPRPGRASTDFAREVLATD